MAERPKNKKALTIYFDTQKGVEYFMAWYLDGGGEQQSGYYSKKWGDNWIDTEISCEACPECEFMGDDEEIRSAMWQDKSTQYIEWKCRNCDHKYNVNNVYKEDKK